MDIKLSQSTAKKQINIVTRICVLSFSLNAVRCAIFCPPALENAGYSVTAEYYNIGTRDLTNVKSTWFIGGELLASCNFTTQKCQFNASIPRLRLTFQVFPFGDDDIQMTLMIGNFTKDLQQTFRVEWNNGNITSYDSCQINIGSPIDECRTQKPCVNGASCQDLSIGFVCNCSEGFSGITCREGDFRLRCNPSSYRIVFNQQIDICAEFNVTCFVAGVNTQTDIRLNLSEISNNGSSNVTLVSHVSSSIVFFKLCISPATHFGKYEILYKIQAANALSDFNLHILPELTNINTVPAFNTPGPNVPYSFDVLENTQPGAPIIQVQKSQSPTCAGVVCIEVFDPDANADIGVDSLVLTVKMEAQQQSVPITYQSNNTRSSFGYFYVSGQLIPGTVSSFLLTATDGGPDSASARVIFRVMDVNNPPVCKTGPIMVNVDIGWQPVRILGYVSCTDNDSVEKFRAITYSIEGILSKYFSVSPAGIIMMVQRVLDLDPGVIVFNVTATGYSDTPDPSFVFTIPVHVNITVQEPTCNLSITSTPNVWAANTEVILQLECDIKGVDKLQVVSWNLQDVFNMLSYPKQSPTVYTITLSVKQYTPAVYNFEVQASLGGASSAASVALAMYNRPRFLSQSYQIAIADTTVNGTAVLTTAAVTDIPNAILMFSIKSGNNVSLFDLRNNGMLYLTQNAQLFVGSTIRLVVEVQDSISGLSDKSEIIIKIVDTNQPPVCENPGPVMINSSLAPFSVITKIICNDSDITESYKNFSYSVSTGNSLVALDIQNNGEIILMKFLPAGITIVSVTVEVSDISLSTLVDFDIIITVINCPKEMAEFGLIFPETPVNSGINVSCPDGYSGEVSRSCNLDQTWSTFNYNNCGRKDLLDAAALLSQLKANVSHISPEVAAATCRSVADHLAESLAKSGLILSGDIRQMVNLLKEVGEVMELYKSASLTDGTLKSFASSSDSIIGADVAMWQQALMVEDEGAKMLHALDSITSASVRNASFDKDPVVRENLAIKRATTQEDIVFPDSEEDGYQNHSGWVLNSNNTAFLRKTAFKTDSVTYSVILYKNVTEKFKVNSKLQDGVLHGKVINSDILSFTMDAVVSTLSPPLVISFSTQQDNHSDPMCGYLNTSASVAGVWATRGCTPQVFSDRVQCSCNHLTNFAVLMSPFGSNIDSTDATILSIISAIGCGISMLCLIITVIIYIILWKYVKCDRAVLHVNLSVCLILAYIVFLVGVDRTESEVGCKVVAALLHYLFLVVFFTMLCEGIEIFKSLTFVFTSESIICQLLSLSYGVPVIIVAVSLGVTKTEGYGSETTCWLSVDNGLIWAFVGPALLVILINFLILIRVLMIMQQSKQMMLKAAHQKTRSVVRTICVLSPLLGVTWVFGVLSVSKETVVFQYLFAIFNSLQGLFIFICYCLLTPQVRDGFKAMRRKYRARSFDSNQRVSNSYTGKYSESESVSPKFKKSSSDFKSSSRNTYTTSIRDSSQTVSSDRISHSKANGSQYGRQESTDSRKSHRSDSDSVFSHNSRERYVREIPLSYTDPQSRINSRMFDEVLVSYPGTFLPGRVWQNPGQELMHRGSLFSMGNKNTQHC